MAERSRGTFNLLAFHLRLDRKCCFFCPLPFCLLGWTGLLGCVLITPLVYFPLPQLTDNGITLPEHVTCSVQWADAVVLVYSVTDRRSFDAMEQLYQLAVRAGGAGMPVILLANKADLLHLRRVDPQQGPLLATTLGCSFYEVSASEDYSQVHSAFHRLCCQLAKQQQQQPAPANSASSSSSSSSGVTEKRRSPLIPRPKSPNMQDLKRRFKQALSAKVRTVTSV